MANTCTLAGDIRDVAVRARKQKPLFHVHYPHLGVGLSQERAGIAGHVDVPEFGAAHVGESDRFAAGAGDI